ncbi:MAG: class I SAM-dependent methyltransferase [Myxococcales bacterium]|nr:class I SAM-dependent methyltransferase [Myxococcales bacterium]
MSTRVRYQRYQLGKHALASLQGGHPWVFRKHMSSAADALADGQWLRLVDGANKVVGYGVFAAAGAVAIAKFATGTKTPTADAWRGVLETTLARRATLVKKTNAYRLVAGDADGVPGVVIDRYDDTLVLQTYQPGTAGLGRWMAMQLAQSMQLPNVVWRVPQRKLAAVADEASDIATQPRLLQGRPPAVVAIREGRLSLAVDVLGGQKSGAFLDLRGLRREVANLPLTGARVLNLFSFTGMTGAAAALAGAAEVTNVDRSAASLAFGDAHHSPVGTNFKSVEADIFSWLPKQATRDQYQLVIVDPPSLTSRQAQLDSALRAYQLLISKAAALVAPGGYLITCSCTSRVPRGQFVQLAGGLLREEFHLRHNLQQEPDHPASFSEMDYLKVLIWQRK